MYELSSELSHTYLSAEWVSLVPVTIYSNLKYVDRGGGTYE